MKWIIETANEVDAAIPEEVQHEAMNVVETLANQALSVLGEEGEEPSPYVALAVIMYRLGQLAASFIGITVAAHVLSDDPTDAESIHVLKQKKQESYEEIQALAAKLIAVTYQLKRITDEPTTADEN